MRVQSFVNERTAEYVLLPRVRDQLHAWFGLVVPLFYWKSREGGTASLKIHGHERVRAIAMFARCPKLAARASRHRGALRTAPN
jgi:hypothetical protein